MPIHVSETFNYIRHWGHYRQLRVYWANYGLFPSPFLNSGHSIIEANRMETYRRNPLLFAPEYAPESLLQTASGMLWGKYSKAIYSGISSYFADPTNSSLPPLAYENNAIEVSLPILPEFTFIFDFFVNMPLTSSNFPRM